MIRFHNGSLVCDVTLHFGISLRNFVIWRRLHKEPTSWSDDDRAPKQLEEQFGKEILRKAQIRGSLSCILPEVKDFFFDDCVLVRLARGVHLSDCMKGNHLSQLTFQLCDTYSLVFVFILEISATVDQYRVLCL